MTHLRRARIDALRPIAIEDLLGRDEVPPTLSCLGQVFVMRWSASPVLVSIGSELCRQILPCRRD